MNVSVIIPVYNAEKFVETAIQSALQLNDVAEVVLVEDGSHDDSLELCKKLAKKEKRIKLHQHPDKKNHGAAASRNLGLKHASSAFIAFLDADDSYLPSRFDKDKEIFENHPDADGVYSAIGVSYFTKKGKKEFARFNRGQDLTTVKKIVSPQLLFPGLLSMIDNFGYFSIDGLTIKKEVLQRMPYWFSEQLWPGEDTELIIRLAYYAKLYPGNLNTPVALRGVHDNNHILALRKNRKEIYRNVSNLWSSVHAWSAKEQLPEIIEQHIFRMKMSRLLTTRSYFNALFAIIIYMFKDGNYFSKSCYYNHFHFFLFGKNIIGRLLVKLKIELQKISGIELDHDNSFKKLQIDSLRK